MWHIRHGPERRLWRYRPEEGEGVNRALRIIKDGERIALRQSPHKNTECISQQECPEFGHPSVKDDTNYSKPGNEKENRYEESIDGSVGVGLHSAASQHQQTHAQITGSRKRAGIRRHIET